jgi:SAM-dependent methyltransferase
MNLTEIQAQLETINACPICGDEGTLIYPELADRLLPRELSVWGFVQCNHCKHLWLSPRYKTTFIANAYKDYSDLYWTVKDTASGESWLKSLKRSYFALMYGYDSDLPYWQRLPAYLFLLIPGWRHRLDRQIRYIRSVKNGKLLDIGSGDGWFLENMQSLGWQVEGVDIDPVSAVKARSRGVIVKEGSLSEQGYPENSFDVVTMSHVIEHLHDPLTELRECWRILRPGGKIVLFTPSTESKGHGQFGRNWFALDPPRHLNLFNFLSMRLALEEAGFQITELFTWPQSAVRVWYSSESIKASGNYQLARPQGSGAMIKAYIFALKEHLEKFTNPAKGEEIVVIGTKQEAL